MNELISIWAFPKGYLSHTPPRSPVDPAPSPPLPGAGSRWSPGRAGSAPATGPGKMHWGCCGTAERGRHVLFRSERASGIRALRFGPCGTHTRVLPQLVVPAALRLLAEGADEAATACVLPQQAPSAAHRVTVATCPIAVGELRCMLACRCGGSRR